MVVGKNLGICKGCTVRFVPRANNIPASEWYARIGEHILQQLTDTLDEIVTQNRQGQAVISMSFGLDIGKMPHTSSRHYVCSTLLAPSY